FTPDGHFADVMTEVSASAVDFRYANGRLEQWPTLPTAKAGPDKNGFEMSGAEIAVHPSGKFVYSSNGGPDNLDVSAIDAAKGTLTPVQRIPSGGKMPRMFAIDPTGAYLF